MITEYASTLKTIRLSIYIDDGAWYQIKFCIIITTIKYTIYNILYNIHFR